MKQQQTQNAREPSHEDILAFIEEIQRQGGDLEGVPPDLKSLLQNVQKQKGQPTEDVPTEDITPEPGCVHFSSTISKAHLHVLAQHAVTACMADDATACMALWWRAVGTLMHL